MGPRDINEELLAAMLARTPEHMLAAAGIPAEALAELREALALVAESAPPVVPSAALRARLLARRPHPRRPEHPVLLVIDMLQDYLTEGRPLEVPRARAIVPALEARLAEARSRGTPIVYVCDQHEEDDPDFRDLPVHALRGTSGAEVWPSLAPEPGDHIVHKPTYSAFSRSTLANVLDELGADELILTGCATEAGLQATATDALQRGYVVSMPVDTQAGYTPMTEAATLAVLSGMRPYDPIYLRDRR